MKSGPSGLGHSAVVSRSLGAVPPLIDRGKSWAWLQRSLHWSKNKDEERQSQKNE